MQSSMNDIFSTSVLYDGAKTFPITKKSIDLLLVLHHGPTRVIEVVSFDAVRDIEAPRLYLCVDGLDERLGHYQSTAKMTMVSKRTIKSIDRQALNEKRCSYVLSHLGFKNCKSNDHNSSIKMCFRSDPEFDVTSSSKVNGILLKVPPLCVIPFDSVNWKLGILSESRVTPCNSPKNRGRTSPVSPMMMFSSSNRSNSCCSSSSGRVAAVPISPFASRSRSMSLDVSGKHHRLTEKSITVTQCPSRDDIGGSSPRALGSNNSTPSAATTTAASASSSRKFSRTRNSTGGIPNSPHGQGHGQSVSQLKVDSSDDDSVYIGSCSEKKKNPSIPTRCWPHPSMLSSSLTPSSEKDAGLPRICSETSIDSTTSYYGKATCGLDFERDLDKIFTDTVASERDEEDPQKLDVSGNSTATSSEATSMRTTPSSARQDSAASRSDSASFIALGPALSRSRSEDIKKKKFLGIGGSLSLKLGKNTNTDNVES